MGCIYTGIGEEKKNNKGNIHGCKDSLKGFVLAVTSLYHGMCLLLFLTSSLQ